MAENNEIQLTEEEKRILHNKQFLDLLSGKNNQDKPKPKWIQFLETTGGVALITVIVGGIISQYIATGLQQGLKDREFQQQQQTKELEFQQAWLKARGDQALAAYQKYLEQEQITVEKAYDLISKCISSADDMIGANQSGRKEQARQTYNKTQEEWRLNREKLGFLMSYYHKGDEKVINQWQLAQNTVTTYMRCSQDAFSRNKNNTCIKEKEELNTELKNLLEALQRSRRYAWEGWDEPEKLKTLLQTTTTHKQ